MARNNRNRNNGTPAGYWSTPQAYVFASITLLIGIAIGYLLHGSGMPSANSQSSTVPPPSSSSFQQTSPNLSSMKVEPLLQQLQSRPNDPSLLADIGNSYYDNHQYQQAIEYYQRALKLRPGDVNVRTDMGTAMWYSGNADGALKEYEQSLKYEPNHGQTLFNMGIVKWQGKKDSRGALQAWQQLLATNPNYPDRQKVEQLMQEARLGN